MPEGTESIDHPCVREHGEFVREPAKVFYADSQSAPVVTEFPIGAVAMFSACSPEKSTVNEDAYAVIPMAEDTLILAVADGAGGHAHGDAAARLAVESLVVETCAGGEPTPGAAIR